MTNGIAFGKITACPFGFPYDAPNLATNLLVDIPADNVKPSLSYTAFLIPRAMTHPLCNAFTSLSLLLCAVEKALYINHSDMSIVPYIMLYDHV